MHNFCRDFHIELLPMHTPKRFSENNDGVLIVIKLAFAYDNDFV